MIINIFLTAIMTIAQTLFDILPDLPDMPAGITNALDVLPDVIRFTSRLVVMFVGRTFYLVVLPLIILLINFNWIYHGTMWLIRKLPIGVK